MGTLSVNEMNRLLSLKGQKSLTNAEMSEYIALNNKGSAPTQSQSVPMSQVPTPPDSSMPAISEKFFGPVQTAIAETGASVLASKLPFRQAVPALGAVGGGIEAFKQLTQRALGEEGAPQTSEEAATRILGAGLSTAGMEGAGRAVFSAPSAIGGAARYLAPRVPFGKSVFEKIGKMGLKSPKPSDRLKKVFDDAKVPYMPGDVSSNKFLQMFDNLSSKGLISSNTVYKFRTGQIKAFNDFAKKIAEKSGGTISREEAGESIIRQIETVLDENKDFVIGEADKVVSNLGHIASDTNETVGLFIKDSLVNKGKLSEVAKNEAYDIALQNMPKDTKVPFTNTYKFAKEILGEKRYGILTSSDDQIRELADRIVKYVESGASKDNLVSVGDVEAANALVGDLYQDISGIGAMAAQPQMLSTMQAVGGVSKTTPVSTARATRNLLMLKDAINKDFTEGLVSIGRYDVVEQINNAKNRYSSLKRVYDSPEVKRVLGAQSDRVVDNLLSLSPETIRKLKDIIGPEDWYMVSGDVANRVRNNLVNVTTEQVNKGINFNVNAVDDFIKKYGRDRLEVILGRNGVEELISVGDLAKTKNIIGQSDVVKSVFSKGRNAKSIPDYLVQTGKGVKDIKELEAAINMPDAGKIIGRSILEDVVEKTINIGGDGSMPNISSAFTNRLLRQYPRETLEHIFTPSGFKDIVKINKIANRINASANLPGTFGSAASNIAAGQIVGASAGAAAAIGGNPMTGVAAAAGVSIPYIYAKMATSQVGRKLLLEGIGLTPGTKEAIKWGIRFSMFLGKEIDSDNSGRKSKDVIGGTGKYPTIP